MKATELVKKLGKLLGKSQKPKAKSAGQKPVLDCLGVIQLPEHWQN